MNGATFIKKIACVVLMTIPITQSSYGATILFDIGGVLLKPEKLTIVSNMGYANLLKYVFYLNNPLKLKKRWFSILNSISAPEVGPNYEQATHRGMFLPDIMAAWLRDTTPCDTLLDYAMAAIEKNTTKKFEQALFKTIALTTFEPETHVATQKWMPAAIDIVHQCHEQQDENGNRKHKLYILSNYNNEAFMLLYQRNKDFFDTCFDGLIISGAVGVIKPSAAIYTLAMDMYNLEPSDCYFIDDQEENLMSAQTLGIHTIHCKDYDYKQIRKDLKKHNIIPT